MGLWREQCCEILTDLRPREIELIESCLGSPGALAPAPML